MKPFRTLALALLALSISALAFAADASPAGLWKWTLNIPSGDSVEASVKLQHDEGKLSGTYSSPFGEAPISKGSYVDGAIVFQVDREFDGNKFTLKFSGKLEGDTIKGTIELPSFDGGDPTKMEWLAKRG